MCLAQTGGPVARAFGTPIVVLAATQASPIALAILRGLDVPDVTQVQPTQQWSEHGFLLSPQWRLGPCADRSPDQFGLRTLMPLSGHAAWRMWRDQARGSSFQMSTVHRHSPSASRRQTVKARPRSETRLPSGSLKDTSFRAHM